MSFTPDAGPAPTKATYGERNLSIEQVAALPEHQRQAYVADLAPEQRENYFRDMEYAQLNDADLFKKLIGGLTADSKAQAASDKVGQQNVKEATSSGEVEYVPGLNPSDADYRGNDHAQLQGFVQNNLAPQQVAQVSNQYHALHEKFQKFSTDLSTAVNKSKGGWEGEGAEAAQNYLTSLSKWSDANSQNAKLASETMYSQSTAASSARDKMPAPVPFDWNDQFKKWVTSNPFDLADNVKESMALQKQSQQAHDEAANVMTQYDKDLYSAASKQPVFAEPPKFTSGGKEPTIHKPGKGDDHTTSSSSENTNSSTNGPGNSSQLTGGGQVPGGGGHGTGGSSSGGGNGSGGGIPGGGIPGGGIPGGGIPGGGGGIPGPGQTSGAGLLPRGGTRPSGFQPQSFTPPSGGAGSSGGNLGGMGAMPMGGMGGMAGGFGGSEDYNSKFGRGGGFGPGGSGSAVGSGSGSGVPGSSGAASGAAKPGGIGAAESAAGRGVGAAGAAGAAGGRGAGGMGGMGAGGRGGKGEEDQEHSRPSFLLEGDPDEVFGTDERTAPPVIGE